MIVAALLAVVLVAGAVVWLAGRNSGEDQTAAPTTTSQSTVTSTTRSTPTPTTPTTTSPPSAAERCTPGFVEDEIGQGTLIRECDPEFLLVTRDGGEIELFTWREDSWTFLAAPTSDVCREQLEGLGVPDRFRRVFQPCEVPTSTTTASTSTSPTTSPTTDTSDENTSTEETPTENGVNGANDAAAGGPGENDDPSGDDDNGDAGDGAA